MRYFGLAILGFALAACSGGQPESGVDADPSVTIFPAKQIVTMAREGDVAGAVAVKDGQILSVGSEADLVAAHVGAVLDESFREQVLVPGLIDPHVHVMLGSLQYGLPLTPPWPMATPEGGYRAGLTTRDGFLAEVSAIEAANPPGETVVIYGYHNLIHGDLTRADLDAITTDRPLLIWHYSSHDFYLNSAAIDKAGFTPTLADKFHGVDLDADGALTGRIYEDAVGMILAAYGDVILAPDNMKAGFDGFSKMLRENGVTTVVEMGYGIFGIDYENVNIATNWTAPDVAGYRLYLVPEHRALAGAFGEGRVDAVRDMLDGTRPAAAPVLPRVKFFTDGAFYSQTMKLSTPGYLTGQSKGTDGLWVTQPDELADTIRPYWDAGYGVNIHSNGDAAQTATLSALKDLRASGDNSFTIEHGGLFSPEQVAETGALGANVSAASHYVFYMSSIYDEPLGQPRATWISPLGSLTETGAVVTVHSDAPLAPPDPLRAASVHMTRATNGAVNYQPQEALSAYEALEAVTLDAARAVGLDTEIGSIEVGKRADFTVLSANPLETPADAWEALAVWGVVLGGDKRELTE